MERVVALKRLRKLLGNEMGWRVDPKAPTADERSEAEARRPALNEAFTQAEKAMQERRAVLLQDPLYQELVTAYKLRQKERSENSGLLHHYRFTVGKTVGGLLFRVMAQGDSWEEVIDIVERDKRKLAS